MNVSEFEKAVWVVEGVRIVIRAPVAKEVGDYNYNRAAEKTWRVSEWLEKRVQPKIGNRQVVVLQGDGEEPHGRVILRTLRRSYEKK